MKQQHATDSGADSVTIATLFGGDAIAGTGTFAPAPLRLVRAPDFDGDLMITHERDATPRMGGLVLVRVGERLAQRGTWAMPLPEGTVAQIQSTRRRSTARIPQWEPLPKWLAFDADSLTLRASGAPPRSMPVRVIIRAGDRSFLVDVRRMQ